MQRSGQSFVGFSPESLDFLREVRECNSKEWFEEHRELYNRVLLNPFQALVADLSESMLAIDPRFEVRPSIDRTISRIFRDTRFSRDKSRYRNAMWLTFKRPSAQWQDAPGYFMELTPSRYRFGMGYFLASRATMDRLRQRIDEDPAGFLELTSFLHEGCGLRVEGESYKRRLPCERGPEIDAWYQRKTLCLIDNRDIDDLLFSAELVDLLETTFHLAAPFYHYLNALRDDGC